MNLKRIKALVQRDYLVFIKSKYRWLEFFYFPVTSVIIWGVFALWTGEFASFAGKIVLVINVFWSYAYTVQSTINLSMNEDAWHSETHHLFVSGIGKWEYLLSKTIFSIIISFISLLLMLIIMHFLFLNISQVVLQVLVFVLLTAFISISLAIFIAGLFFILGRDYAWLAWSALQFFILLSFPLSPIDILPSYLQNIARVMPYGNLFEGLRSFILGKSFNEFFISSFQVGAFYLILGLIVYRFGIDYSRKSGKFAKMF
ncbi:MAG: ABC transporter permease [Candidatus Aenigmatarchaeota archaeon]